MAILSPPILRPFQISFAIPFWVLICASCSTGISSDSSISFTLESVRDALTREEDTIIYSLIERAKSAYNSPLYDESKFRISGFSGSLLKFFVYKTEILEAQMGRYRSLEERPFLLSSRQFNPHLSQVLYPAAVASINVSKTIWNMYINEMLPLFTAKGQDGKYALTAASDLACLQAFSRRVHYGMFVAEAKFRDAPQDYMSAIRAQDRDALMKLVTSESVEELVKRRVRKKAKVFGQEVGVGTIISNNKTKYKIDPSAVSRLYGESLIPLTKLVEVDYLLHRLD